MIPKIDTVKYDKWKKEEKYNKTIVLPLWNTQVSIIDANENRDKLTISVFNTDKEPQQEILNIKLYLQIALEEKENQCCPPLYRVVSTEAINDNITHIKVEK